MRRLISLTVAGSGLIVLASTAYATVSPPPPVQVAEPGTLGILGAAVTGLILAGRFIRRR